ncbi:MAG: bifunctional methylenetetrahydrofolate dehydrogenase/methenyltetrahydrofolate cyclohydrolase FolD [Planctomycetales bacterium]|nr:bifunctional methylenetetrahydrofolate dehydrogenase/methenyltetrahydrofolate cyclohydrolase FolD [Planctomycetales bacterium]
MTATILDGKQIAADIRLELTEEVAEFIQNNGVVPCLAAVLVGEDPASDVYVRSKRRGCEQVGMESQLHRLPAETSEDELLALIHRLNKDDAVHGILIQLPLPKHIRESRVLDAVHPLKDVDAFHPENVGLVSQGRPRYLPCTPHGVVQILHRGGIEVAGKHVVVVGRSDIVGKPMAMMLAQRDSTCGPEAANATVTVCHSRTPDLAAWTRQAEVLIAAIGKPCFITGEMIRPGAAVIDVGINRTDDGLCGDVDFASAREVAGAITPVPGGVGPLTVTMLLYNTLAAARTQCTR